MEWNSLPHEIRSMVLGLQQARQSPLAIKIRNFTRVCKEWETTLTRLSFQKLSIAQIAIYTNETITLKAIQQRLNPPKSARQSQAPASLEYNKEAWLNTVLAMDYSSCMLALLDSAIDDVVSGEAGSWRALVDAARRISDLHQDEWDMVEFLSELRERHDAEEYYQNDSPGYNLLVEAAAHGGIELATKLLEGGVPVKSALGNNDPLFIAAANHETEIKELLFQYGATWDFMVDYADKDLLDTFCKFCSVEDMSEFFQYTLEIKSPESLATLDVVHQYALDRTLPGNEPVARYLIEHGLRISSTNIRDVIAKDKQQVSTDIIQSMIDKVGGDAELIALNTAAATGNKTWVEYLLGQGVKPRYLEIHMYPDDRDELSWEEDCYLPDGGVYKYPGIYRTSMTPYTYTSIFEMLVNAGATPDVSRDMIRDSLYHSVVRKDYLMIELFLEDDPLIELRPGVLEEALCMALIWTNAKIVQLILDRGAEPSFHWNWKFFVGTALERHRERRGGTIRDPLILSLLKEWGIFASWIPLPEEVESGLET